MFTNKSEIKTKVIEGVILDLARTAITTHYGNCTGRANPNSIRLQEQGDNTVAISECSKCGQRLILSGWDWIIDQTTNVVS